MKKGFIGLLIIVAGAAIFFLLQKKNNSINDQSHSTGSHFRKMETGFAL